MEIHSILWQRLDGPGHDACRLEPVKNGWELIGTAVFLHGATPACLSYRVGCDANWRTTSGRVQGWIGPRLVDTRVVRTEAGEWLHNGGAEARLDECVDLDLGFTPATNLLQVKRIALAIGQSASVPVAWLDVDATCLQKVPQRYERRAEAVYWYESPQFEYAAPLTVRRDGFVAEYPGLWKLAD